MRYSEAEKRVIYEPVSLPQDFRTFDFLMPWEGPAYVLPGDEKAKAEAPGAPTPVAAPSGPAPQNVKTPVDNDRTSESPGEGGSKNKADEVAKRQARRSSKSKAQEEVSKPGDTPDPKPRGAGRRRPGGGAG
jgi:NADH-quinone oxidoreductase subunit C